MTLKLSSRKICDAENSQISTPWNRLLDNCPSLFSLHLFALEKGLASFVLILWSTFQNDIWNLVEHCLDHEERVLVFQSWADKGVRLTPPSSRRSDSTPLLTQQVCMSSGVRRDLLFLHRTLLQVSRDLINGPRPSLTHSSYWWILASQACDQKYFLLLLFLQCSLVILDILSLKRIRKHTGSPLPNLEFYGLF